MVGYGIEAVVGEAAMAEWGWRIPFLFARPLGLIGLYLRMKIEDTPVFRGLAEQGEVEGDASGAFKYVFREY